MGTFVLERRIATEAALNSTYACYKSACNETAPTERLAE
jgi:hypothetical protein